jgi:hypothetical protein
MKAITKADGRMVHIMAKGSSSTLIKVRTEANLWLANVAVRHHLVIFAFYVDPECGCPCAGSLIMFYSIIRGLFSTQAPTFSIDCELRHR